MIPHLSLGKTAFSRSRQLGLLIKTIEVQLAGNSRERIYGSLDCSSGKRMKVENRGSSKPKQKALKLDTGPVRIAFPKNIEPGKPTTKKTIMMTLQERLNKKNWKTATNTLSEQGFVLIKDLLSAAECSAVIAGYNNEKNYRKTVNMERYRFGLGEYKYYDYPLPELIAEIREKVYPIIVPVANKWMQLLNIDKTFPDSHKELKTLCHNAGQTKPTPLILKYGVGGFNTLHQDLYGDIYFPMQVVIFLNQPGKDYTGGEFVLTEQMPRAQSKANVIIAERGDMLIFTTNFRPAQGSKGYYRVNMKHGVSAVHNGSRHTLGIIFHDALT